MILKSSTFIRKWYFKGCFLFAILISSILLSSCVSMTSVGGPHENAVNNLTVADAARQTEELAAQSDGVRFCYRMTTSCHMGITYPGTGILKAFRIGNDGKHFSITVTGIRFESRDPDHGFEWDDTSTHSCSYSISPNDFILYDHGSYRPWVIDSDGHYVGGTIYMVMNDGANGSVYGCDLDLISVGWTSRQRAQEFVDAMDRLFLAPNGAYAQALEEQQSTFDSVAMQYRGASPKPRLPQNAQIYAAQASDAFAHQQNDEAISYFRKALDIAPWWPAGRYNLALLLANNQDYEDAIDQMKKYLQLVPNASDAQKAQQQIWVWQGREQNNNSGSSGPNQ